VLKAAVGLLGDLGQIFGARMAPVYRMPFVASVRKLGLELGLKTGLELLLVL
jgi:hypothetical protein